MIAVFGIISAWAIPVLVTTVLIYASWKKIPIFDTFVEGGKEGFNIAISLLPYMVGMLVALGIFRESGAFDLFVKLISPITNILGIPGELVPLAIMRPISGNGALAISAEIMQRFGPDSLLGLIASTMQGSTDTTFYILTVYFGAVGIRKMGDALKVGLLADLAGIILAIVIVALVW